MGRQAANGYRNSFSLTIPLGLTRAHAWDVLWREEGQRKWLGPASRIHLHVDALVALCDESGPWRQAVLVAYRDMAEVLFQVEGLPGWPAKGQTRLSLSLCDSGDPHGCLLRIKETRIPAGGLQAVSQYWHRRKQLLQRLDRRLRHRRENPRQAVVLIHGIGEQQPGEMLYSFLGSGVLGNKKSSAWIKPDRLSRSFELRMATLNSDHQRPTTDVFEIYWAHIIRDTTLDQLTSWLAGLLMRWPLRRVPVNPPTSPPRRRWTWNVPRAILPLWLAAWLILLSVLLLSIGTAVKADGPAWVLWLVSLPLLVVLVKLLWQRLGLPLAINYLGDAARYLQPHPDNIAHRQAIRTEGVELLEKLHDSGRYDRIVLLGHSLGSVIAYDILTHAWARMNALHQSPTLRPRANGDGPFQSLRHVEKAAAEKLGEPRLAQRLQHEAWKGMRVNTQPWLVTDLITLGSPLAHAEFLLARDARTFQQQKRNRSLPTSPPWLEVKGPDTPEARRHPYPRLRFSYEQDYRTRLGYQHHTFTFCHHAAAFAVTRWSNVHTPTRQLGFSGDLVSGELAKKEGFGRWIVDRAIYPQPMRFMHTWYWRKERGRKEESAERMNQVKRVLRLDSKEDLIGLNDEIPAFTFLSRLD